MDSGTLIRVGILVALAPLWWPVVKLLYLAVWEAGEEDVPERPTRKRGLRRHRGHRPAQARKTATVWSDPGEDAWTKNRRINPQWDTGRKAPSRHGFGRRAG